jgi:hypothetical protein
MSIWEYANPRKFMTVSAAVLPWVWTSPLDLPGRRA